MSETHTPAPNPLAVSAVSVYGPRLALERVTQNLQMAQLDHREAVDRAHYFTDRSAQAFQERRVAETRGALRAAIDMLVEVVALVAPLLPVEGE